MLFNLVYLWMVLIACSGDPIPKCPDVALEDVVHSETANTESVPLPQKSVLLLDYSGSMCPGWRADAKKVKPIEGCAMCDEKKGKRCLNDFYYGSSQFSEHVAQWIKAASPNSEMQLEILLFNGKVWCFEPGKALTEFTSRSTLRFPYAVGTHTADEIQDWIDAIPDNPCRATRTCGTTLMQEALEKVQSNIDEDTMVWLMTDNIIDYSASELETEEAQRNKRFYDYINDQKDIAAIVTYPLNYGAGCSWMCGTSMFTYGMYFSKKEESLSIARYIDGAVAEQDTPLSDGLLWNPVLQRLAKKTACKDSPAKLHGVPIRLKPIDDDVLSLRIGEPSCQDDVQFNDTEVYCLVEINVKNNLHHQVVEKANLYLNNQELTPSLNVDGQWQSGIPWAASVCADDMQIVAWEEEGQIKEGSDVIALRAFAPREERKVYIKFSLPNHTPQHQEFSQLVEIATTNSFYLRGKLQAKVSDIETSLAVKGNRLQCVYGASTMPQIFQKRTQLKPSYALHNLPIRIQNNGKIIALAILGVIALASGFVVLGLMRFQSIPYELKI
ncbi:MAG: hypothetical protein VX278_08930, partial [Myxococcota bacterium]|nr:hypothetical protein [Myxococcota bacterium]